MVSELLTKLNVSFAVLFLSKYYTGPVLLSLVQFFITTAITPWLDGKHVVFGKVTAGKWTGHCCNHLTVSLVDHPATSHLLHIYSLCLYPHTFLFAFAGMEVVKQIESLGSASGRTSQQISIVDCGQLA